MADRRNFETHIQNQYTSEIENLKAEHQEQIASIEAKIAEKMQNEIKKTFRPLQKNKLQNILSPSKCSNKKSKHYNNLT